MTQTMVLPGTYIEVRDEGLISPGGVVTGNIGIVGTAEKGPVDQVQLLGSLSEAKEIFGESDEWQDGTKNELTLIRALELIYKNGGQNVYAVRTAKNSTLSYATYELKDDSDKLLLTLKAKTTGTSGNQIKITVTPNTEITVKLSQDTIEETYSVTNIAELKTEVNQKSALVEVDGTTTEGTPKSVTDYANFTGGKNGADATSDDYARSLALLENEIVNIVLLAGQDVTTTGMSTVLEGHLKTTAGIKRERIGIIGSGFSNAKDSLDDITKHTINNDRIIFTAPGILVSSQGKQNKLPGSYLAAAVAGMLSSLPVQTSPTNKTLTIEGLTTEFNSTQLEKLVTKRVLTVEKRAGFRIVKGITTDDGAWKQITTRRIVDYAIYGVRSSCNPYIGKLNNERVRGAMKATLNAFLTRMVDNEALVSYQLDVSATRAQEKEGKVMVTMTLMPTFSIDFIQVTMYLE
ncbi:phage tail sheath C-terminal domain-containing protein [Moorena sp. SIO3A2]|uniref:phage tail sheath C-terminal domain-containing protein n=1 Tax=Moorena sp. SIO3A2 TaxID=2607841 RepID=UPI0013BB6051|nr:phage tail sheath C-terminal domain-containing protein [Moorena sp. SIO3A2]NER92099.1 phage tail protein [Moorena sp. SIO3A2]